VGGWWPPLFLTVPELTSRPPLNFRAPFPKVRNQRNKVGPWKRMGDADLMTSKPFDGRQPIYLADLPRRDACFPASPWLSPPFPARQCIRYPPPTFLPEITTEQSWLASLVAWDGASDQAPAWSACRFKTPGYALIQNNAPLAIWGGASSPPLFNNGGETVCGPRVRRSPPLARLDRFPPPAKR